MATEKEKEEAAQRLTDAQKQLYIWQVLEGNTPYTGEAREAMKRAEEERDKAMEEYRRLLKQ